MSQEITKEMLLEWIQTIDAIYREEMHRGAADFEFAHYIWTILEYHYTGDDIRREVKALHDMMKVVYNPKTREQLLAVQTNFCNLHDSSGRVQFTPFIGGMSTTRQIEWMENERNHGSTHIVVSIDVNGYGQWKHPDPLRVFNFYLTNEWENLRALIERCLSYGLAPIVFLHSGDSYAGADYYRGFCTWWNTHLNDLTNQCIFVSGWETRRHGGHTAFQFNECNNIMHEILGSDALIAFHGSQETGIPGANNEDPNQREEDDPWMGVGEDRQWYTHCCKFMNPFLFQTRYTDNDELDEFGQPKWWNRTADTVQRFLPEGTELPALKGMKEGQHDGGWHYRTGYAHPDWFGDGKRERPTLVAFEYVAYGYIRGYIDDNYVNSIAHKLYDMGFRLFGNGQPK